MKNNKKEFVLFGLGLLGLIIITVGVTYAFFNYTQEGVKENSITTGNITFIYTENTNIGNGISIEEAYPMSDDDGKVLAGNGQVFDFKVTSSTGSFDVGYEITARMESDSTLTDSAVKLYLTKVAGLAEEEIVLAKYNELTQTTKVNSSKYNEKTLYVGEIPANQTGYEDTFRLRMWITDDIDFSNGNYNGKSFTLRVNVYANAEQSTNTYTAYNIGDAVTLSDGSKWHVLEDSDEDSETVTLLSDYNLNSDGTYNTTCGSDINSTYACSTMAFDPNSTQEYDVNDSNNIGYFIKNTYEPLVTESLAGTTNVTIPTVVQIATAGGQNFNENNLPFTSTWLLTTSYWTKTVQTATTDRIWVVSGGSGLYTGLTYSSAFFGTRPVITTLKSNIVKTMTSETALSVGTQVTAIDGSKWHVLEASVAGTDTVTLLSDYNLNTDGTYNTTCGRDVNSISACSTMAFDSDNTNTYDKADSNNIGYFIKNTYEPLVTTSLPGTTNVTIPTAFQIAIADEQTFNQTVLSLTNSWLLTTNYWTKTNNNSSTNTSIVWEVYGAGLRLSNDVSNNSNNYGVRPVITTPKSNLLAE